MAADDQGRFLRAVQACPNGIYRMSPDVEGLTQTSNNLARIELKDGKYTAMCLTRSSVDSEKMDEANAIKAMFELIGAKVEFAGSYPGWTPRPGAGIVKLMSEIYREALQRRAARAGLSCRTGMRHPRNELPEDGDDLLRSEHQGGTLPGRTGGGRFGTEVLGVPAGDLGQDRIRSEAPRMLR